MAMYPRDFRVSMTFARVAGVPIPDVALSVFFAAGSSTKEAMFFIAWRRDFSVKRVGGLVFFASSSALVTCPVSPFFRGGSVPLSPSSSSVSSSDASTSPPAEDLKASFQPSFVICRPDALSGTPFASSVTVVCRYSMSGM